MIREGGSGQRLQACGSFDVITGEYSFTLASGQICLTFDFLSREDIQHIFSCLSCLLGSSEITTNGPEC
jgi:hypothetical protein